MAKIYVIAVTIEEGSDEFWENLEGRSGCDEVVEEVRACLEEHGFTPDNGCRVQLERFEEK